MSDPRLEIHAGDITQLAVEPEYRRRGVAAALLDQYLAALRHARIRRSTLLVSSSNRPARSLYQRVGYADSEAFAAYWWPRRSPT